MQLPDIQQDVHVHLLPLGWISIHNSLGALCINEPFLSSHSPKVTIVAHVISPLAIKLFPQTPMLTVLQLRPWGHVSSLKTRDKLGL